MNDDFQIKFRKTPRPEFVTALYQRINRPMQTQTTLPRGMRFAALTLSLFIVLTVTLFLSPSIRTFAQSLLRQIGGYTFTQGVPQPLDASKLPASINIVDTSTSTSIELTGDSSVTDDPVSAGDLAGFPVLAPSYLPLGYIPMDDGWRITPESNSTAVTNGYFDTTKNYFFITQWKVGEGDTPKTYTREEIVDVTVRGQNGVWLPNASANSSSVALVWAENGITYSIISNALSLDEILKVAESLGR
jgi:hypothetical protein